MCGLNLTCARYTQRFDDSKVPSWWTCAKSKISMTLDGYVHDPAAAGSLTDLVKGKTKPKRQPWKTLKPQKLPHVQTREERNQARRERYARTAKQWGN